MALARGAVVVLRRHGRDAYGLVWRVRGDALVVVPITGAKGPPRHRAEVSIDSIGDMFALGVPIKQPVLSCHQTREIAVSKLVQTEPIGHAPAGLVARVALAIAREIAARIAEERLSFGGFQGVPA